MTTKTATHGWELRDDGRIWDMAEGGARELVCILGPDLGDSDEYEKAMTYARLIAAAPDLLAALERLIAECETNYIFGEDAGERKALDMAEAAIAKATT